MRKPLRLAAGLRRHGSRNGQASGVAEPAPAPAPEAAIPASGPVLAERAGAQAGAPQHFVPPTAREVRAQAVKRLQVGILGLASMLLLIGLANIIMQHARQADAAAQAASGGARPAATGATGGDPLADIGVAPAPEASGAAQHHAAPRPAGH